MLRRELLNIKGGSLLDFTGTRRIIHKCGHDTQVIFLADGNGIAIGKCDFIANNFNDMRHIYKITFVCPDKCRTGKVVFNLFQSSGKSVIFAGS